MEIKGEKTGIRSYYLALGLILLAVSISLTVVLTQREVLYVQEFDSLGANYFTEYHDLVYNVEEDIIKDITGLSYDFSSEKILINGHRGFEFYVGGFFSLFYSTDYLHAQPTYDIVQTFDWRDRHNVYVPDPGNPYYDGDYENKSGWMTEIDCQYGCWLNNELICPYGPHWAWGDYCEQTLGGEDRSTSMCATISSIGALEGLFNIYYNHHYDFDLSEQQFGANPDPGNCWNYFNGTFPSEVLNNI